jgi:TetR/AcrR family transcriptional regulator, cholesterol catabolism regulator
VTKGKALRKTTKGAAAPRPGKVKASARRHHDANIDHILGSAAKLFAEKSFGLASIREIAARANISFPRIYYYLRNKEELLYLVAKRGLESSINSYAKLSENVTDPAEKLRIFIDNHFASAVHSPAEATVLVKETSKLSAPYLGEIQELERQYTETCRTLLEELSRANGKELSRTRSRVLVSLLFGALNSMGNWYEPARDAEHLHEITNELYQMYVSAVK